MRKRIAAILLSGIIAFGLAGCTTADRKVSYKKGDGVMSRKKKKKKASKMVRTSKKPISLTCLINKKPICQMDIFR
jgi:hypothetical protein